MSSDEGRVDAMELEQLLGLGECARRYFDLVPVILEHADEWAEERHVRRVRDVDPDAHRPATLLRPATEVALNWHTCSARHSMRIGTALARC